MRQFGELPPDMQERQQYAAWKAADIRKALREGRTPIAGPAVKSDLDFDLPDIPGMPLCLSNFINSKLLSVRLHEALNSVYQMS